MMLRFPYLPEPLQGPPPPTLPVDAIARWRPLVPLVVYGRAGRYMRFGRALVDSGADDTILPLDSATLLGVDLLPAARHGMRWRGQRFALRFGNVELELMDDMENTLRWPTTVAFTAANVRYPLLGMAGCLKYLDARFLGNDQLLELEANPSLPAVAGA